MEQKHANQLSQLTSLLILALRDSPVRFSRNSSKEVCDFFLSYTQKPLIPRKTQIIPATAQPEQKAAIPQPVKIEKPKLRPQPARTLAPIDINPATLLEIERSPLLKLLPRKTIFEHAPPLDLKKIGIRFTDRRSPLPAQTSKEATWVFGVTPTLLESGPLKLFIDNIMKAAHQQLQRPNTLCSFLNPVGLGELAAYAVEQTPIFLFSTSLEIDIVHKLLKKLSGFKEYEKKEELFAPFGQLFDSPLVLITIDPQTPSDMFFKRSLWNALKARAQ